MCKDDSLSRPYDDPFLMVSSRGEIKGKLQVLKHEACSGLSVESFIAFFCRGCLLLSGLLIYYLCWTNNISRSSVVSKLCVTKLYVSVLPCFAHKSS